MKLKKRETHRFTGEVLPTRQAKWQVPRYLNTNYVVNPRHPPRLSFRINCSFLLREECGVIKDDLRKHTFFTSTTAHNSLLTK